jgi:thiamine-monophosphate kinase
VVLDLAAPHTCFAADLAAVRPAAEALGADAVAWVLAGGEDHGLLATFRPGAPVPEPFAPVGTVRGPTPEHPAGTVLVDGLTPPAGATGWDHFRP